MSCGCAGKAGPLCRVDGKVVPLAEVEREVTRRALARLGRGELLDGIRVRWLGVVWRGVPEPLRWALEWRGLLPRELPGCGCIDALKRFVEALAAFGAGQTVDQRV